MSDLDRYVAARRYIRQADIYRTLDRVGRATDHDTHQLYGARDTYDTTTRRWYADAAGSPRAQARRLVASLLEA